MRKEEIFESVYKPCYQANQIAPFHSLGLRRDIELEVNNITILHLVIPSLLQVETLIAHLQLRAAPVQILPLHHLRTNKPAFEVSVNDTSGLGGLHPFANGPALDLVFARREVMRKLQGSISSIDESMDHCGLTELGGCGVTGCLVG